MHRGPHSDYHKIHAARFKATLGIPSSGTNRSDQTDALALLIPGAYRRFHGHRVNSTCGPLGELGPVTWGIPAFVQESCRRRTVAYRTSTQRLHFLSFVLVLLLLNMEPTSCAEEVDQPIFRNLQAMSLTHTMVTSNNYPTSEQPRGINLTHHTCACLRPVDSIKYELPVNKDFTFLPPIMKSDLGLGFLYQAVENLGVLLIPVPTIPAVLLTENLVRHPSIYFMQNLPVVMREYPRLTTAAVFGISLALVFPVVGCLLLTCRCCCGACGGATDVEEGDHDRIWKCCCFLSLGICCFVMIAAMGLAVVSDMFTYAGIADTLPFCNRSIADMVTGYLKTQDEVDTLLIKDYGIFETEMGQRLDSCVQLIGNDIEKGLATSPLLLIRRLVDQISRMKTTAEKTRTSAHELADQVSQLAERLTFPVASSNVAKVTDKCVTISPRPPPCEAVLNAKALLNAQSGYLPSASGILDVVNKYAATLTVTDAALQLFQTAHKVDQGPASKVQFLQAAGAGVTAAKARLKSLGDDLADKANLLYIDILEYPEDLMRGLNEHVGRPYRKAEKFIYVYVGGSLSMVSLLLLITFLYLAGMITSQFGGEGGTCSYRSGRWCFSCGACCFVLLFGAVALVTTVGMTASILGIRVACGLADKLYSPAFTQPIRFGLSFVRDHSGSKELRALAAAVSAEQMTEVMARFSACDIQPTSAYHLAGEAVVRKASIALGLETQASFLWAGFDHRAIDAQLENIGGIGNETVDLNQTKEIAAKLNGVLNYSLAIPTDASEPDLKSQVSTINTNTDNADQLKQALVALKSIAAAANMATEVDEAEKEVDDIVQKFHNCTRAKTKLQDDLTELDMVVEVNGKPVDTFKMETLDLVAKAGTSQEEFKKASAILDSRKQSLISVVKGYTDFMKDTVGNCKPAHTMYRSAWEVGCKGVMYPFSGFWFSVATYLAVGIPAMFMALFMSTLYSRQPKPQEEKPPGEEDDKGAPPEPEDKDAAAKGDEDAKYKKKPPPVDDSFESFEAEPRVKKPRQPKKVIAEPESEVSVELKPKSKKAKGTAASSPRKALAVPEPEESEELMPPPKKSKSTAARSQKKTLAAVDSDESIEVKAKSKKGKARTPSVLSASSCSCIFTNTPTPEPERPENKLDKDDVKTHKSLLKKEPSNGLGEKHADPDLKKGKQYLFDDGKGDPLIPGDHESNVEKKDKKKSKKLAMRAELHHKKCKDLDKKIVKSKLETSGSEESSKSRDWGGGEVTKKEWHPGKRSSQRHQEHAEEPDQRESPTDLLALVYGGSRAGIGSVLRAMSQKTLSSGSSILESATTSSRSLARNLFRRYKVIEDDCEEGSSIENNSQP